MKRILIKYKADKSLSPSYLPKHEIWDLSWQLRETVGLLKPNLVPTDITKAIQKLLINFQPLDLIWELDDDLSNLPNRVLGACRPCKDGSDQVFINLNRRELYSNAQMLTTLGHELGHAIFDVPAILAGKKPHAAFHRTKHARGSKSPAEWRANEFMGSFLVPKRLLQQYFIEISNLYDMPVNREMGGILDTDRLDRDMLSLIIDELAFKFGVSQTVIEIRLQQYGLVCRSPKAIKVEQWQAKRRGTKA